MRTFLVLLVTAVVPSLAASNPRTVVALEDTHFRMVGSDDRELWLAMLGDLAVHRGEFELVVDEGATADELRCDLLAELGAPCG
ncbi:MAG: hypothetical protein ABMA64_21400 [Myxococcota bacterium]